MYMPVEKYVLITEYPSSVRRNGIKRSMWGKYFPKADWMRRSESPCSVQAPVTSTRSTLIVQTKNVRMTKPLMQKATTTKMSVRESAKHAEKNVGLRKNYKSNVQPLTNTRLVHLKSVTKI